jgi:hypothetical protein
MVFYASFYQFTLKCWDDESLECPWFTHPLPELYDPTSVGAEYAITLSDLYVNVVQKGGSDNIAQLSGEMLARCLTSTLTT